MKKLTKEDKAILECYVELYKASTPSADFMELIEKAPLNEFHQKVIDYNAYLIEEDKCVAIIEHIIKKYKFKDYMKQRFKNTIYLGCSPKFKKD